MGKMVNVRLTAIWGSFHVAARNYFDFSFHLIELIEVIFVFR